MMPHLVGPVATNARIRADNTALVHEDQTTADQVQWIPSLVRPQESWIRDKRHSAFPATEFEHVKRELASQGLVRIGGLEFQDVFYPALRWVKWCLTCRYSQRVRTIVGITPDDQVSTQLRNRVHQGRSIG